MTPRDKWVGIIGLIFIVAVIIGMAIYVEQVRDSQWHPSTPLSASLARMVDSDPESGVIVLKITLITPNHASIDEVEVNLFYEDPVGTYHIINGTNGLSVTWQLNADRTDVIESGDVCTITLPSTDIRGYVVSIVVEGYSGIVEYSIPLYS